MKRYTRRRRKRLPLLTGQTGQVRRRSSKYVAAMKRRNRFRDQGKASMKRNRRFKYHQAQCNRIMDRMTRPLRFTKDALGRVAQAAFAAGQAAARYVQAVNASFQPDPNAMFQGDLVKGPPVIEARCPCDHVDLPSTVHVSQEFIDQLREIDKECGPDEDTCPLCGGWNIHYPECPTVPLDHEA